MVVDATSTDPLVVYTKVNLGEGATGQVFEGWYQGKFVAVKRMNESERGALRELDAYRSGKLRHPSLELTMHVSSHTSIYYVLGDTPERPGVPGTGGHQGIVLCRART